MFLPIEINEWGYMYTRDFRHRMVHRETRYMHFEHVCNPTLDEAKARVIEGTCKGVLELTEEGGGHRVWVFADEEEVMRTRLQPFKACYGAWDVGVMHR